MSAVTTQQVSHQETLGVAGVTLVIAVFLTGFLQPTIVQNVTPGDVVTFGLICLAWANTLTTDNTMLPAARPLALPVALILFGSLVGMMSVGIHAWSINHLVRDAGALLAFLAALDIARHEGPRALTFCARAIACAGVIVTIHLLVFDSGTRVQALFPNPNVAGHYLATMLIVLHALPMKPRARWPVSAILLAGLLRTSSFGALLQLTMSVTFLLAARFRKAGVGLLPLIAASLFVVPLAVVTLGEAIPEETTDTTGIAASRLDRSSSGRIDLWMTGVDLVQSHPLGIGPDTAHGLDLLDGTRNLHNEPLGYLVERGVIGLTGLILLFLGLWRMAPPGSVSRALILGFVSQSLVRQTLHYRHLWLGLALALAAEMHRTSPVPTDAGRALVPPASR